jgi:hypothetical protein
MATVEARVKNGRLVLDEPTHLPEGQVVELVTVEDAPAGGTRSFNERECGPLDQPLDDPVAEARVIALYEMITAAFAAERRTGEKVELAAIFAQVFRS